MTRPRPTAALAAAFLASGRATIAVSKGPGWYWMNLPRFALQPLAHKD